MTTLYECPYCGKQHPSPNGTGSDIACCGEVGHCDRDMPAGEAGAAPSGRQGAAQ